MLFGTKGLFLASFGVLSAFAKNCRNITTRSCCWVELCFEGKLEPRAISRKRKIDISVPGTQEDGAWRQLT